MWILASFIFFGGGAFRCGWGSDEEFEKRTVEPHESERFVRRWWWWWCVYGGKPHLRGVAPDDFLVTHRIVADVLKWRRELKFHRGASPRSEVERRDARSGWKLPELVPKR